MSAHQTSKHQNTRTTCRINHRAAWLRRPGRSVLNAQPRHPGSRIELSIASRRAQQAMGASARWVLPRRCAPAHFRFRSTQPNPTLHRHTHGKGHHLSKATTHTSTFISTSAVRVPTHQGLVQPSCLIWVFWESPMDPHTRHSITLWRDSARRRSAPPTLRAVRIRRSARQRVRRSLRTSGRPHRGSCLKHMTGRSAVSGACPVSPASAGARRSAGP